MADFVYNNARVNFATGVWNWPTLAVNAALVTAGYTPQRTHVNLSEVPAGALLVRDLALTGLGVSNTGACYGIIPATPPLLSALPCVAVLLYIKGLTDSVSPLVYYSSGGNGFPFTPASLNYQVAYDLTAGGFFEG